MAVLELTSPEIQEINRRFDRLLDLCNRCKTEEDRNLIRRSFDLAFEAHKSARRKSGEPYIIHPIEVATIVTYEIGLDPVSVASALLHDVVEDTDYTVEDIKNDFGDQIAQIVDGLTKISDSYDSSSSLQAENFRKMLLTLSDDVRVILVKLADRLHNMRTLASMPAHKQLKIAGETLYLYAPLAHRMGLYAIKTELEDLSFKYSHPKEYNEINSRINKTEKNRILWINRFSLPISEKLTKNYIKYKIEGRPKSYYSIFKKMKAKNVTFEEIYDIMAIRVVFEPVEGIPEKTQCWNIYSMITDIYKPKPDRIRDWVSTPKANGYEALHSTVMGPDGQWVEVQIRTDRMNEIAEKGFAAHWKYKGVNDEASELDKWINKIKSMLNNPEADAVEFLNEFKMNLYTSEIVLFTPKGHMVNLPKNASVLDFAYEIHSEIGNHCIGAKVNHKLVPLSHKLQSGDQVEVLTSEKQSPQKEWAKYVLTAKAKSKIKNAFREERKEKMRIGKEILDSELKELNLQPSARIIRKLFEKFSIRSKDELYFNIGTGNINLAEIGKALKKKARLKLIRYYQLQLTRSSSRKNKKKQIAKKDKTPPVDFVINEETEPVYDTAKCCNPIPGDTIMGFRNDNGTITVHKTSCEIAIELSTKHGNRIVNAKWISQKKRSFLIKIKLNGIDSQGLVNNVTTIVSKELDVNMRAISFESHDGVFEGQIDLYVHDTKDLNNLIMKLMKVKGVESVKRIE